MNQQSLAAKLGVNDKHSLFRHRFGQQLIRDARLGARHFILEGNLTDWFYNPYFGTKDFLNSLVTQLLWSQMGVKRVLVVHQPKVVAGRQVCVTDFSKPSIDHCDENHFAIVYHPSLQDAMFPDRVRMRSNVVFNDRFTESSQSVDHNLPSESLSSYRTAVETFPRTLSQFMARDETAFVFCDFFTQAGFYNNLGGDANVFAELLDSIWKMEDCLTIIPCESTESVEKNFFPKLEDRVSVVRFGPPGICEIELAISRGEKDLVKNQEGYNAYSVLAQNSDASLRESVEGYVGLQCAQIDFSRSLPVRQAAQTRFDWKFPIPSWSEVVLAPSIKKEILKTVEDFRKAAGAGRNSSTCGILLSGPPGTGKTLIAKALAANEGFSFVPLTLSDIKAEYLGQTAANIRRVFDRAKGMAPVIVFVDEVDAVIPIRGHEASDSYTRDAVCELLAQLDGVRSDGSEIFFVAATNRGDLIDGAALSRLKQIEIALPDQDARRQIFSKELKLSLIECSDPKLQRWLERCSAKSCGLSGRDIKRIVGAILGRLGLHDEVQVFDLLMHCSDEILDQIVDDALVTVTRDIQNRLLRAGAILSAADTSRVPGDCLRHVEKLFSTFCKTRNFVSRFRSHHLPPISRLLLRADRVHQSERLIQILGAKLDSDVLRVDASSLARMTIEDFDEWVDDANRLTTTRNLVVYLPTIEQISPAIVTDLLAKLSDKVVVVGTSSTMTAIDDLFDLSAEIPLRLTTQTIEAWVNLVLRERESRVNLQGCNLGAVAVQFAQQKTILGLCGIEREIFRALRQAVMDQESTDTEIKLRFSHFRELK